MNLYSKTSSISINVVPQLLHPTKSQSHHNSSQLCLSKILLSYRYNIV